MNNYTVTRSKNFTEFHGVKKSYTELLECAVTARNKTKHVMYDYFTVLLLEIRICNPSFLMLHFLASVHTLVIRNQDWKSCDMSTELQIPRSCAD